MSRTIVFAYMIAAMSVLTAAETKPPEKLTPAQRVARKQLLMKKRFGGYIDKKMPGSGIFAVIDSQRRVPPAAYEGQIPIISDVFAVEMTNLVHDAAIGFANAGNVLRNYGANAGVFIVDQKNMPTLCVVPESGWAFVNVAALAADSPDADRLALRVRREVWRGFAMASGSTDTEWPHCLLGPITSLKALDTIDSEAVSPEPMTKIARHLTKLGILPFKRTTYKQACIEGWAPPPQDEFQRAVWNRVKSDKERGPTNPITIERKK